MKLPSISGTGIFLTFLWLCLQTTTAWSKLASGEVATTIQLKDDLEWQFESDIGTMHFYGGGELWSVDLMSQGKLIGDPIPLSGTEDSRSVRHLPRSNLLLVTQGLIAPYTDTASESGGMNSYAIDLFSGTVLWESELLGIPDEIHYFRDTKTVVLRAIPGNLATGKKAAKKPSQFTAVDVNNGKVLWQREYVAQHVSKNGAYLEVMGSSMVSIEAVTGKETRIVDLPMPSNTMLMPFLEINKVLTWKKKKFALYEVPELASGQGAGQGLPVNIDANKVWQIKSKKSLAEVSNQPGLTWGPKYISDELLLIKVKNSLEVVDFASGRSLWDRKATVADLEVSPAGTYGAFTKGKKLFILDMKTGDEYAQIKLRDTSMFETAYPRIMWRGEDEFLVVLSDAKQRPRSISRIGVSDKSILWTTTLPDPAKYRMTTKEKGKMAVRIFAAVALTAVSFANPMVYGNTASYFIFIPNLNVKQLPETSAGLEALEDSLVGLAESARTRALRRYVERSRLISSVLGKQGLFVTGDNDHYQIINFDMVSGNTKVVADYSAQKVHGIEPDVV